MLLFLIKKILVRGKFNLWFSNCWSHVLSLNKLWVISKLFWSALIESLSDVFVHISDFLVNIEKQNISNFFCSSILWAQHQIKLTFISQSFCLIILFICIFVYEQKLDSEHNKKWKNNGTFLQCSYFLSSFVFLNKISTSTHK